MGGLLGAVLLAGIVTLAPALAQSPMSPIYPTDPAKPRPARPPVKEIAPAPDHEPSKPPTPVEASPVEKDAVATAVIPPRVVEEPRASAEPKKPVTAEDKPEVASAAPGCKAA